MAYTTIKKPSDYFNTKTYTGNNIGNQSQSVTGVGFQPDFTWIKNRSQTSTHRLTDAVRGVTKDIYSNLTTAEGTNTNGLTAFGSDGFTVGSDGDYNNNGSAIVSWNWKANGTGVANTDGSITSTVSASATSGFSIVKYTGNQTSGATVGTGLGAVPKMIIVKNLNDAEHWQVYHISTGNTKSSQLSGTGTPDTSAVYWNNTSPTNSVFTIGNGDTVNNVNIPYIAYCFADVQGYSKFGSYTGTSSEVFNYTGFKPRFILIKKTSAGASWHLFDTSRTVSNGGNQLNKILFPNLSNAEVDDTYNYVDAYSNGFRCFSGPGGQGTETNINGGTFIYMCFAEQPLVGDNPATAR